MTGSWIANTDDGSLCESGTSKCIRTAGNAGKAENSVYFKVHKPSIAAARSTGVFVVKTFNIAGGLLRIKGQNAFALMASGKIIVGGVIDATGGPGACPSNTSTTKKPSCAGPGGYRGGCQQTNTVDDGFGPGRGFAQKSYPDGAGGGGHGGKGGNGGGKQHGNGGSPYGPSLTALVGGSGGGGFGVGSMTLKRSCGGGGGGAVQLVSSSSIEVVAKGINVGGGGGDYGDSNAGAGGGSGGLILLEAPVVSVKSVKDGVVLAANGGGGGAGGSSGAAGETGALSCSPAKGGTTPYDAGGGNGGAGTNLNGAGGKACNWCKSGGGGGAAGRIRIHTAAGKASLGSGCATSPAPTTTAFSQGTVAKCP